MTKKYLKPVLELPTINYKDTIGKALNWEEEGFPGYDFSRAYTHINDESFAEAAADGILKLLKRITGGNKHGKII